MYRNIFPHKNKGFTLIELIVVMTIISIVFIVSISFAQALGERSNNAKRQSDLRAIESALQQYKTDQGFYPCSQLDPTACPTPLKLSTTPPTVIPINSNSGNPNTVSLVKTYLTAVPADPLDGDNNHCYIYRAYKSKTDLTTVCNNDHTSNPNNDPNNNCHYFRLMTVEEGSSNVLNPVGETCSAGSIHANYEADPN